MRLAEFDRLMNGEFGPMKGPWIRHSHVIAELGATADEAINAGVDPAQVWRHLCEDFRIPQSRWLGEDI